MRQNIVGCLASVQLDKTTAMVLVIGEPETGVYRVLVLDAKQNYAPMNGQETTILATQVIVPFYQIFSDDASIEAARRVIPEILKQYNIAIHQEILRLQKPAQSE